MDTNTFKMHKGDIQIVDDTPANLKLLSSILTEAGYEIRTAINGEIALESIQSDPPELILLDIMMPGISGFQVCKLLKANEQTREIPVIFISAMSNASDKVKGFALGGIDYIIKPFQEEEVLARVETHLSLWRMRKQLKKQNEKLIEAAHLREDVEHITRHDLKTPLNSIICFPQIMRKAGNLPAEHLKYLKLIEEAGLTMLNMINLSLDMFKMERRTYKFKPSPVNVLLTIRRIINDMESLTITKKLAATILVDGKPDDRKEIFSVQGEELLCYSMLANLIKNAFEASPPGERITIALVNEREMPAIRIHNKGAVPEDIRDRFFDKYVTSRKKSGTGLGTYSARLIAETQEGSIHLDTSEAKGTAVTVRLLSLTPEMRSAARTDISASLPKLPAKSERKEIPADSVIFDKATILIADDLSFDRTLLTALLKKYDFEFFWVKDGRQAVELARERHPDMILMDMKMPIMDGSKAAKILKSEDDTKDIPIIAVTAATTKEDEKYICTLCDGYIKKPVKKADLIAELTCFLKHSVKKALSENLGASQPEEKSESVSYTPDAETIKKIPELVRILKAEFIPRQEELDEMLVMDDASQFAEDLGHAAREYKLRLITGFCKNLYDNVQIFDVVKVKRQIAEFPRIIERLEHFIDKNRG